MVYTDFSHAVISSVFECCELSNAGFIDSHLHASEFKHCHMWEASFARAHITNGWFFSDLSMANFENAVCDHVGFNFMGSDAPSNLTRTHFINAKLISCDLSHTICNEAAFIDVDFTDSKTDNMNLRNARLNNVINPPFVPDTCPQNCTLTGYVPYRDHIITLQIQKNAKRAGSTSNLCFAEKAKVTSILSMKGNPAKITSIDRPSLCGKVTIGKFLTSPVPIPPSLKPKTGYGVPFYLTLEEAIASEWRSPLPPA